MAIITIPKILQEKLTEEGADALVEILDKVEERSEAHTLRVAEERFEKKLEQTKSELKEGINKVDIRIEQMKTELRDEITKVDRRIEQTKTELRDEITKVDKRLEQVKSELKSDIANVRADLIKWMFIFWAGQVITITGILIAFLKK
jgi:rubrerythrin